LLFAAVFNLITNLIFIPFFGMKAAAITTVSTECVALCFFIVAICRSGHLSCSFDGMGRVAAFLIIMGLLFWPLGSLNIIIAIPLAGIAFLSVLLPFRRFWFETTDRKPHGYDHATKECKSCVYS